MTSEEGCCSPLCCLDKGHEGECVAMHLDLDNGTLDVSADAMETFMAMLFAKKEPDA